MRADELACEGLKNKNKMYLQKFLLTIFFVLLSAKGTKELYGEAQPGNWNAQRFVVVLRGVLQIKWFIFWREARS